MANDFIVRLLSTISSFSMIASRDRVLVALSGGADSTALLSALAEVAPRFGLALFSAHVHHGLRGAEADRDAAFAERIAREIARRHGIEIPFYLHRADVKKIAKERRLSVQEAGRIVRDAFFRDIMQKTGATKIATGHTGSDNAETFLMRLITGAGPEGLSGIPPVRLPYVRPLIETTRSEIEAYLAERDIPWIIDSSNLKNDYLRNRVRNEIMPALAVVNPGVERSLMRAAASYRDSFGALRSAAEEILGRHAAADRIDVRELSVLSPMLLSEVVKLLVFRKATRLSVPIRLSHRNIEAVMNLITAPAAGTKTVPLPGGLFARRVYEDLVIESAPASGPSGSADSGEVILCVPGDTKVPALDMIVKTRIDEKAKEGTVNLSRRDPGGAPAAGTSEMTAVFDADLVGSLLIVRTRRPGDRIGLGEGAGTKKISDLFIDAKVPRDLRDRVLLVVAGDEILWVVGYMVDGRVAVTEKTRRVLTVSIRPAGA